MIGSFITAWGAGRAVGGWLSGFPWTCAARERRERERQHERWVALMNAGSRMLAAFISKNAPALMKAVGEIEEICQNDEGLTPESDPVLFADTLEDNGHRGR